jgi:putative tricarboxylic transport membrane protein
MAKNDKISGILLLTLFLAALCMALQFPKKSAYFPVIVCSLGVLLSAILIIRAFVQSINSKKDDAGKLSSRAKKMIALMSLLIVLYAVGMQVLGFCVSTFAFMLTASYMLYPGKIGKGNKKTTIIILASSIIVTVIVYVIFKTLLYVPLPSGILI